jgi:hypothetical protein
MAEQKNEKPSEAPTEGIAKPPGTTKDDAPKPPRLVRWWSVAKATTSAYAFKNPEWIYTFIFFLVLSTLYAWRWKFSDDLTDHQYVRQFIDRSKPDMQIKYISKMLRGEAFEIDRNFLTSAVHVEPQRMENYQGGVSLAQTGKTYGLIDFDREVIYRSDGKEWTGQNIDLADVILPFGYDNQRVHLIYENSGFSYLTDMNPDAWVDKSFFGENEWRKIRSKEVGSVFFLDGSVATTSEKMDTISIFLPLNYSTDDSSMKPGAVISVLIPPDQKLAKLVPFNTELLADLVGDKGHTFRVLTNRGEFMNIFNDDLLKIPRKSEVQITSTNGLVTFFWDDSVCVVNPSFGFFAKKFKIPKGEFGQPFQAVSYDGSIIWLLSVPDDAWAVAKINTQAPDSISFMRLPEHSSLDGRLNVNEHGMVVGLSTEPGLANLTLFTCENKGNKFDTLKLQKLLAKDLFDDLSMYEVNLPLYSSEFEFIAHTSHGIGSHYQFFFEQPVRSPLIVPVFDKRTEKNSLRWPSWWAFDVDIVYDYFFLVILFIGLIVVYFFGLFYILNFKNRDVKLVESFPDSIKEFSALNQKLTYTKKSMSSLKLRSEIMLWLGIAIGILGMVAFILSLKIFFKDTNDLKFGAGYVVLLLRTFGVFAFMEVFCFYFLKQYRITFNEYKRFFSLYLRLMNYCQYIEMATSVPNFDQAPYKDMREAIFKDNFAMHEETMVEKINEFEKSIASDIVKTLANKIPTPPG